VLHVVRLLVVRAMGTEPWRMDTVAGGKPSRLGYRIVCDTVAYGRFGCHYEPMGTNRVVNHDVVAARYARNVAHLAVTGRCAVCPCACICSHLHRRVGLCVGARARLMDDFVGGCGCIVVVLI
jgi:hypothetical protein